MQLQQMSNGERISARLSVSLASTFEDVRKAQRLRWLVFSEEQGARLSTPEPGYDIDDLDDHCEHLIVTDFDSDTVVGTYRLLTAETARRVGGYYSEREFELDTSAFQIERVLELGRSCVHPDHRTGATIALLWSGVASFLVQSKHSALIGCASISLLGQEADGARLAYALAKTHRAPPGFRAIPRCALPVPGGDACKLARLPPLLKGYLRSGALVCGDPCWDADFNSADLLLHLGLATIEARYARRFLGDVADAQQRQWQQQQTPTTHHRDLPNSQLPSW